ncbi:hypothetical protein WN943_025959 [Citrus x changshan-huyou]
MGSKEMSLVLLMMAVVVAAAATPSGIKSINVVGRIEDENEMSMPTEESRRHLNAGQDCISYDAMLANKVLSLMFLMLAVVMTMARPVEEDGRRQLGGGGGFISYDALKADSVPCNQRGASYYGCRSASGPVNPYRRECSTATNCQRSTG